MMESSSSDGIYEDNRQSHESPTVQSPVCNMQNPFTLTNKSKDETCDQNFLDSVVPDQDDTASRDADHQKKGQKKRKKKKPKTMVHKTWHLKHRLKKQYPCSTFCTCSHPLTSKQYSLGGEHKTCSKYSSKMVEMPRKLYCSVCSHLVLRRMPGTKKGYIANRFPRRPNAEDTQDLPKSPRTCKGYWNGGQLKTNVKNFALRKMTGKYYVQKEKCKCLFQLKPWEKRQPLKDSDTFHSESETARKVPFSPATSQISSQPKCLGDTETLCKVRYSQELTQISTSRQKPIQETGESQRLVNPPTGLLLNSLSAIDRTAPSKTLTVSQGDTVNSNYLLSPESMELSSQNYKMVAYTIDEFKKMQEYEILEKLKIHEQIAKNNIHMAADTSGLEQNEAELFIHRLLYEKEFRDRYYENVYSDEEDPISEIHSAAENFNDIIKRCTLVINAPTTGTYYVNGTQRSRSLEVERQHRQEQAETFMRDLGEDRYEIVEALSYDAAKHKIQSFCQSMGTSSIAVNIVFNGHGSESGMKFHEGDAAIPIDTLLEDIAQCIGQDNEKPQIVYILLGQCFSFKFNEPNNKKMKVFAFTSQTSPNWEKFLEKWEQLRAPASGLMKDPRRTYSRPDAFTGKSKHTAFNVHAKSVRAKYELNHLIVSCNGRPVFRNPRFEVAMEVDDMMQ